MLYRLFIGTKHVANTNECHTRVQDRNRQVFQSAEIRLNPVPKLIFPMAALSHLTYSSVEQLEQP